MTIEELRHFEKCVADLFKAKWIRCPIHLSGGNERELTALFKLISPADYVFSTHRNHYHYLLHTRNWDRLFKQILKGDSMHTCDPKHNFYSSSIVGGCVAIACGVALALKMKKSKQKVWVFVGDGATDEGWFTEALKYATAQELPITYIIEDNDRSVCTNKKQRWGKYEYICDYPHVGIGEFVNF
jgi:pyruvate dehydrogenase E1 component alpha subunit